jgi:hypothetical protein
MEFDSEGVDYEIIELPEEQPEQHEILLMEGC